MAAIARGYYEPKLTVDNEGYREYSIKYKVESDPGAGPVSVIFATGLPLIGSQWSLFGELDIWVWCRPECSVTAMTPEEKCTQWIVEKKFSNKPLPRNQQRCQDNQITDPLLEPQKVSGSFTKYTEEARFDKNGLPIVNSAWEQIRGSNVEFDANRPTVKIEQNVSSLQLPLFSQMVDTVNISTLWGLPPRCIKLSNASWERKFYGTCYLYYTRTFEFDIRYDTFDRLILDEGTKVLNGRWGHGNNNTGTASDDEDSGWVLVKVWSPNYYGPLMGEWVNPNPYNPAHFIKFTDRNGNPTRVILNGKGKPWDIDNIGTDDDQQGQIFVQKYAESNFALLGIPTLF